MTLLFYYLLSRLCISSFWSFTVSPFYSTILDFYTDIPAFYAKTPCYLFSMCFTVRSARVRGEGWGGVLWVSWRRYWSRTRFYSGVRFNPPT